MIFAFCLLAFAQPQELIDRLGADSIEDREDAEKKLEALGKAAIPGLEKIAASGTLEERTRARAVLRRILLAIHGRLVTLSPEGEIETWDPPDLAPHLLLQDRSLDHLQCLANGTQAIVEPVIGDMRAAVPRLVELDREGGGKLSPVRGWASASPDGKLCIDVRSMPRLQVLDGVTGRKVAEVPRSFHAILEGAWSPDGTRIAFTALFRENEGAPMEGATFVVKADGTDLRRLGEAVSRISWSPDSKELLCLEYEWPKLAAKKVLLLEVATGTLTAVTDGASGDHLPRLSPDGKRIAFIRVVKRQTMICTVERDGSGVREVARGHSVRWSPDGECLAFLDEFRILILLPRTGGEGVRLKEVKSFDWVRRTPPGR